MDLSVEVIDHIFSFLKSSARSLLACSNAHPILAQIVERHLYHHVIITTTSHQSNGLGGYNLKTPHLIKLLFRKPKIVDSVRILEFSFQSDDGSCLQVEYIAPILSKFHALRCIKLTANIDTNFLRMPISFRAALEDCLRLPALQEAHFVKLQLPISESALPNITHLSFTGLGSLQPSGCTDSPFPQLESLSVSTIYPPLGWVKHLELQSLTCHYSNEKIVEKWLRICPNTLTTLDFCMGIYSIYETVYNYHERRIVPITACPKLDLSSLPCLQRLTVRVLVRHHDRFSISCLPAAVQLCKTASSRLQRLTVDIRVDPHHSSLSRVHWSPLVDLAEFSASFDHIDFYIHSTTEGFSRADVISALAEYQVIKESIERGRSVIHVHEAAPELGFVIPSAAVLTWEGR